MAKRVVKPEIRTVDKETGEVIVTEAITEEVAAVDHLMKRGFKQLFKTPFNHNTEYDARQYASVNNEPSMTQKHQAEETDINVIMKKFGVTGVAPGAKMPPSFLDVPADLDLQGALQMVAEGREAFESQPAEVRAYFRNDMARYSATVDDLRRRGDVKGLAALGLVETPPEEPEKPPKATPEPKADGKADPKPQGGKD